MSKNENVIRTERLYGRIAGCVGKMPEPVVEAHDVLRAIKAYRSPDANLQGELSLAVDTVTADEVGDLINQTTERLARVQHFQLSTEFMEDAAANRLRGELEEHAETFLAGLSKQFAPVAKEYHELHARSPQWMFANAHSNVDRRDDEIARKLVAEGPDAVRDYHRLVELGKKLRMLVSDAGAVTDSDMHNVNEWLGLHVGNWDAKTVSQFAQVSKVDIGFDMLDVQWLAGDTFAPKVGITAFLVLAGAELSMPATLKEYGARKSRMSPHNGAWGAI